MICVCVCACVCVKSEDDRGHHPKISRGCESHKKRSNPRTVSFNGEHDDRPWDFLPDGVMPLKEDMSFAKAAADLGANVPSCHVAEAFSAARRILVWRTPNLAWSQLTHGVIISYYIICLGYFVIEIEPIYSCKIVEDRLIKFWCSLRGCVFLQLVFCRIAADVPGVLCTAHRDFYRSRSSTQPHASHHGSPWSPATWWVGRCWVAFGCPCPLPESIWSDRMTGQELMRWCLMRTKPPWTCQRIAIPERCAPPWWWWLEDRLAPLKCPIAMRASCTRSSTRETWMQVWWSSMRAACMVQEVSHSSVWAAAFATAKAIWCVARPKAAVVTDYGLQIFGKRRADRLAQLTDWAGGMGWSCNDSCVSWRQGRDYHPCPIGCHKRLQCFLQTCSLDAFGERKPCLPASPCHALIESAIFIIFHSMSIVPCQSLVGWAHHLSCYFAIFWAAMLQVTTLRPFKGRWVTQTQLQLDCIWILFLMRFASSSSNLRA